MTKSLSPQARNEAVKARIVEAVPELFSCCNCQHRGAGHVPTRIGNKYCSKRYYGTWRSPGLEDVLRTLSKIDDEIQAKQWGIISSGKAVCLYRGKFYEWILGLPYDDQPQPTKDFLYSVLFPQSNGSL